MKAYSDNKTVYIMDFIKYKHKKAELNSLEFSPYNLCIMKCNRKTNNKAQFYVCK